MKLFDEAAEMRINRAGLRSVTGIHELVTVVVHFYSAVWTNHLFFCLNHRGLLHF